MRRLFPGTKCFFFEESIREKIFFYGAGRVMYYLSPKNKVKFLRTLSQLRYLAQQGQNGLSPDDPFYVVSSDPLGRLSVNRVFEDRINAAFDRMPDLFAVSDLESHFCSEGRNSILGIPLSHDKDAVYIDFTDIVFQAK